MARVKIYPSFQTLSMPSLLPAMSIPPAPVRASRWLRAVHGLATVALGAALMLWMLLILAAALLYFWAIPHIDNLRPSVASFLSQQLHAPVQIERISVQNVQGFPTFDLHQLQIMDAANKPQLTFAKVSVSVSPLSLLQLKAERWMLDAPSVHILRSRAGVWSVAGITADPNAKPGAALDWLFSQKEIIIERGQLSLQDDFFKLPVRTFTDALLVVRNGLRSHSLRLDAKPDAALGQAVRVLGQFKQPLLDTHAGHWQAWTGQLYAKLEAPVPSALLPYVQGASQSASATWPAWAGVTALLDKTAQFEVWCSVDKAQLIQADAAALHIPQLAKRVQVHIEPTAKKLNIEVQQFDLTSSTRIAKAAQLTPAWLDYLERAKPSGQLKTLKIEAVGNKVNAQFALDSLDASGTADLRLTLDQGAAKALDFQAQLSRLELSALPRFLPDQLPLAARQYLHASLLAGVASNVRASVNLPERSFKVTGQVAGTHFAFAPFAAAEPWPSLQQGKAEISLEGRPDQAMRLSLHNIDAVLAGLPVKGSALIADLKKPIVEVTAQSKAPVQQLLTLLESTPLKRLTQSALSLAQGEGAADVRLALNIPVAKVAQTTVRGTVTLDGSASLRVSPITPTVSQLKGAISFDETGFALQALAGKALGGDVRLSGGVSSSQQTIKAEGQLTANGLQQYADRQIGYQPKLWPQIKGSTAYVLSIAPLASDGNNLRFDSDLVGLELALPAPLTKAASTAWPLQYQQGFGLPSLHLTLAQVLQVHQESPKLGLGVTITAPTVDASGWQALLGDLNLPAPTSVTTAAPVGFDLRPQRIGAHIGDMVISGRHFSQLVVGATRTGQQWHINAKSGDMDGYAEYRPGQLLARLERLSIPADNSSKTQIEQLLTNEQLNLPAIDLIVNEFELGNKKLGKLEVQAANQRAVNSLSNRPQQEWRIGKLWLTNPDAGFKGAGVWNGKSVDLPFQLDIHDSGDLLARFGLPGTIKGGKGQLQGRIGWLGSPLALHYPSLTGQLRVDIEKGQFLKADPGVGRLLSVLSLQALPRRLTLDFRDVFSEGFAFDAINGDAQIKEGIIDTQNLQMKSVLALVSMQGSADIAKETQDLRVLVLPDINAGGASLLAAIINPVLGAATYLAQLVLRRPVIAAATKEYRIEGSWREPKVSEKK